MTPVVIFHTVTSVIDFEITKNSDPRLRELAARHYSQPKGFVGRNICAAIYYDGVYYGHIVAGSALKYIKGREWVLGRPPLNTIISNTFYHVEKVNGRYPIRNFTTAVLTEWRRQVVRWWYALYGDSVVGFETLIELPRTGELYRRDGWIEVGVTKGQTCKRTGGKGTDTWSGRRVWDTVNLRPKRVFVRRVSD